MIKRRAQLDELHPNTVASWEKDGITHFVIKHPSLGHYCGYCRFLQRPVEEDGYGGILMYVPVHGGITLAEQSEEGMTYGFDCAHSGDDNRPECRDLDWLRAECERMAMGIQLAAHYEARYLLGASNQEKAAILDAFHEDARRRGLDFHLSDNFGAMLNVLGGDL